MAAALDKDEATALVLLDYSKGFDMLHHVVGSSAWLCIVIVHHFLRSGVPQGSSLDRLLYIIFTSNFMSSLRIICIYADDIELYLSFAPSNAAMACQQINNNLTKI
ncbi:hypothetical protein HUJ05_000716 [Dendroctonus ponderosae]|nr:hypothetical protein HUJ05_000716 [Dendroctonus ponderosae]